MPHQDPGLIEVRSPPKRPQVLVVDDNATNRELLRSLLAGDADIIEAPDGPRAIELVEHEEIDLVLLDVMLPGLTGYDVCRKMREIRPGDYLPILLLTSLSEGVEKVAGFEAGADDFISKPFNTNELRLRVRAFLRTRRLQVEGEAHRKDLLRLHDLKDDLVALLVHDLRNPLAGLMAHLHLLDSEPMTADARESVESAYHSTERLRDLIDDLLKVRRLEDDAFKLVRETRNLTEVVDEVIRTMDGAARENRMTVVHDASARVDVAVDVSLLKRAVENLLANAIRFGGKGTAIIVRTSATEKDAIISVQDAGPGIPAEERILLFSKYGSSTLRHAGLRSGQGLGLYLVGLVMRLHDGNVFVDDAQASGTRVVMTLPKVDATPSSIS